VGTLGIAHHNPVMAMLGFAGGLLHTVNHALFKSLLFLGAGAVYSATGTRDIERLGGLARRLPLTCAAFMVGAAAIIGVPPFNGFVSEWLVYQGLFHSGQAGASLRLALLGIPALALVGALALACFAKVAGVVFLGAPRSASVADAREGGRGITGPQLTLAAACVALGVVPTLGIALVSGAARQLSVLSGVDVPAIPAAVGSAAWTISLLALVTLLSIAGLLALRSMLMRGTRVRLEPTWGCAYEAATPRMQYTASSFAAPLLSIFGRLSGIRVERTPTSLHTHPVDLVLDGVALPLWRALHQAALRLRGMQQGRLHWYLLYVLASLLVLLGYLAFAWRL
jgi:NADH:ubiquinone oxidoreductase subunit 5 (subunit L)/multisubunit Na+/H+ antiporter MnhA subunit